MAKHQAPPVLAAPVLAERVYVFEASYERIAYGEARTLAITFTAVDMDHAFSDAVRFYKNRQAAFADEGADTPFGELLALKVYAMVIGPIDAEGHITTDRDFPREWKCDTSGRPIESYIIAEAA